MTVIIMVLWQIQNSVGEHDCFMRCGCKIKTPLSNLGLANQTVTMSPVADIGLKKRQYSAVVVPGKTIQESSDAFCKDNGCRWQ